MNVRAHDRRRSPWFAVDKPDLSKLADICDSRLLPYARSVYFAIVETANDQRSQDEARATQAELATRAGVSVSTLKKCSATLLEAGLLEVSSGRLQGEPNVWVLVSADDGGVAAPRLPGSRAATTGVAARRPGGSRTTPTPMETSQQGKEEDSLIASQSESDRVWQHYQATRPNGNRCKLGDAEKRMIRNALAVRDTEDVMAAISGLFRSDWHVRGGFIGIKYALVGGGRSPDVATTIDRLAHLARNGNGNGTRLRDRTYNGLAWDELLPAAQASVKEAAAMGLEVWDGGKDAWQDRVEVPMAMMMSSPAGAGARTNGHASVTAATFGDDE